MKLFKRLSAMFLAIVIVTGTALSFPAVKANAADDVIPPESYIDPTYTFKTVGDIIRDRVFDFDSYAYDSNHDQYDIEIDVSDYNLSVDSMDAFLNSFYSQYNEIFFLRNYFSYSYKNGYVTTLYPVLRDTPENTRRRVKEFAEKVNEIVANTPDFATDRETALYLHDYLASTCQYNEEVANGVDTPVDSRFYADGAILDKDTVCQGYSYAYDYLLGLLGVKSTVVVSTQLVHSWNAVKLGSYWYHVDITWDDPVWDRASRVLHTNFLLSSNSLKANGHTGWDDLNTSTQTTTTYNLTDTSYEDNTLFSLNTPVSYENGIWYYSSFKDACNTEIRSTSDIFADTVSSNLIKTVYHSHTANTSGACWQVTVAIAVRLGKIYYATHDKIYSCNLDGTGTTTLASPSLPSTLHSIYGVVYYDNTLLYNIIDLNETAGNPTVYTLQLPPSVEITDNTLSISDGKLFGLETFTSISALSDMLNGEYQVYKNGKLVTNGYIGTGYVVCRVVNGTVTDSVTVSIVGDVYGDGITNAKDVIFIKLAKKNATTIDEYAADINGDGTVDTDDIIALTQIVAAG